MSPVEFLQFYRKSLQPKITAWFDNQIFIQSASLVISDEIIDSEMAKNFFVLRYEKDGKLDGRSFNLKRDDPHTVLITAGKASITPSEWELSYEPSRLPTIDKMWPVPVGTDTLNNKTLILDSNHTLVNLLHQSVQPFSFPVIRISGANLENIISDFYVLNRQ